MRVLAALALACLPMAPGCALSHRAPSGACGEAPTLAPPLTDEQREALVYRLRHELTHLADAVGEIADGTAAPTDHWDIVEDDGLMEVRGELGLSADRVEVVATIRFVHFTGRHGGWGLSALEGHACATIIVSRDPAVARVVEVSGAVGLVEDGPLMGAPTTAVWYRESGSAFDVAVGDEL